MSLDVYVFYDAGKRRAENGNVTYGGELGQYELHLERRAKLVTLHADGRSLKPGEKSLRGGGLSMSLDTARWLKEALQAALEDGGDHQTHTFERGGKRKL